MFTVRRVNSDEWQIVRAVRFQALEESPDAFMESLTEANVIPESVWQTRVQENSEGRLSICFLAFFQNEPIGIAVGICNPEGAPEARLVSMWVMPQHRGKGVAARLLMSVAMWARNSGAKTLVAAVTQNNKRAVRFYSRAGFEKFTNRAQNLLQLSSDQIAMFLELDASKEAARNKKIVREFVEAINDRDWEKLPKLVSPCFIRHSSAAGQPGVKSREDLIEFLDNEFNIFPDAHETIDDLIAEEQKVAARHQFTGTQSGQMDLFPASGKKMVANYLAIYRLEAGRIVEAWVEWDNLSGLRQLGHYK